MGRTACTEPQCLCKGALYLFMAFSVVTQCRFTDVHQRLRQTRRLRPQSWRHNTADHNLNAHSHKQLKSYICVHNYVCIPTYLLRCLKIPHTTERQRDNQCTYNITLRRVRATIVAVGKKERYIFWVCVCSLRYEACIVHVPYCYLLSVWLYINFPHYLLMMSGVSLETCWAIKKHWNNKFYYTVASCWFFFLYNIPSLFPNFIRSRTHIIHQDTKLPKPLCYLNCKFVSWQQICGLKSSQMTGTQYGITHHTRRYSLSLQTHEYNSHQKKFLVRANYLPHPSQPPRFHHPNNT